MFNINALDRNELCIERHATFSIIKSMKYCFGFMQSGGIHWGDTNQNGIRPTTLVWNHPPHFNEFGKVVTEMKFEEERTDTSPSKSAFILCTQCKERILWAYFRYHCAPVCLLYIVRYIENVSNLKTCGKLIKRNVNQLGRCLCLCLTWHFEHGESNFECPWHRCLFRFVCVCVFQCF
jgi:hypothetical protein